MIAAINLVMLFLMIFGALLSSSINNFNKVYKKHLQQLELCRCFFENCLTEVK